jgi:hypothetical protein
MWSVLSVIEERQRPWPTMAVEPREKIFYLKMFEEHQIKSYTLP